MVKRTGQAPDQEPEESDFPLPSEKEHLFQVSDFIDNDDPNIIVAKCEVVGGDEEGLSLLNRVNLDFGFKGFFYTRLFLKAIGEPYKGNFEIDSDHWIGRQFYATVIHNGKYANISEYNYDKKVEQFDKPDPDVKTPDSGSEVKWED